MDNKKETEENLIEQELEHTNEISSIGFAYQNSAALAVQNVIDSQRKMIDAIPKIEIPTINMPSVSELGLTVYQNNLSAISDGLTRLGESMQRAIVDYMPSILQSINSVLSSFAETIARIDFAPMFDALRNLNFDFDFEKYEEQYLNTMYESRWFPYVGQTVSFAIIQDINDILSSTRQSKNRIKKIDACIFSYYNDLEIDSIKKYWRSLDLPSYIMRILYQAIKAYKNKEYAVTTIVLSSLWEGIVANKASHNGYRVGKQTKERFNELIMSNDFPAIFSDFYDKYIMYDCHSTDDVIDDVPGRHGIAHGWYSKYPSRKAALNAILFTDLLLQLKPIQIEVEGDENA